MKPVHKKVVGRMFSLQDSLPKLPVPALDATLQKYLKTVRPLVPDEDYKLPLVRTWISNIYICLNLFYFQRVEVS
jgi:hypothetical protein